VADPQGARPSEGAYLNYPLDDLLRLLALESVRHQAIILGEDLGTVPEGLRESLAAKAVLGMRVLPFEQDRPASSSRSSTGRTTPWPPPAPTTWRHWPAGWQTRDIDWNNRLQLIDAATESTGAHAGR
jgi:4-alpha-glucanotransferase